MFKYSDKPMFTLQRTITCSILTLATLSIASASSVSRAEGQPSVSELMRELNAQKIQLAAVTDRLNASAALLPHTNWEIQAIELNNLKEHINRIGDTMRQIDAQRAKLTASQQSLFERMTERMNGYSAGLQAVIAALNDNRLVVRNPAHAKRVADLARIALESKSDARRVLALMKGGAGSTQAGD